MRSKRFLPTILLFAVLALAFVPGMLPSATIEAAPRMGPPAPTAQPTAADTGRILTIPVADYVVKEVPILRSIEFQLMPTSAYSGTGVLTATLTATQPMTATGNIDATGAFTNTTQAMLSAGPISGTNVITVSWNQDAISVPWQIVTTSDKPVEISLSYKGATFIPFDFLIKRVAPLPKTAGFNDGIPNSAAPRAQQNVAGAISQTLPTAAVVNASPPAQPNSPPVKPLPQPPVLPGLLFALLAAGIGALALFRITQHRWPWEAPR